MGKNKQVSGFCFVTLTIIAYSTLYIHLARKQYTVLYKHLSLTIRDARFSLYNYPLEKFGFDSLNACILICSDGFTSIIAL